MPVGELSRLFDLRPFGVVSTPPGVIITLHDCGSYVNSACRTACRGGGRLTASPNEEEGGCRGASMWVVMVDVTSLCRVTVTSALYPPLPTLLYHYTLHATPVTRLHLLHLYPIYTL